MNKHQPARPINLDLSSIRFPIPAIISILHRISGVVLCLLIPAALWALHASLVSQERFNDLQQCLAQPLMKIFIWLSMAALLFHLVAGVRHLLMDLGMGNSLRFGRASSWVVLTLSVILMIGAGVWLW